MDGIFRDLRDRWLADIKAALAAAGISGGTVNAANVHGVLDSAKVGGTGDHNHTAAASDGGTLTNDLHDGYGDYAEIATPATPAANHGRLYGKDVAGVTLPHWKDQAGTEYVLGGGALAAHDHTATAGDGGVLTNDEHDGFSSYVGISDPASPAATKVRLYAKSKALYSKNEDGLVLPLAGSGGTGAATIYSSAYGSARSSAVAGDLWLSNDSYYLERYTGSIWEAWGPLSPLVRPADLTYTWQNQSTGVADVSKGALLLTAASSATESVQHQLHAAPATPWTATDLLGALLPAITGSWVGFVFRESSTGKFVAFKLVANPGSTGLATRFSTYSNDTTRVADYAAGAYGVENQTILAFQLGGFAWFRFGDDGTNIYAEFSALPPSAGAWYRLYQQSRTAHLAGGPDQYGFASAAISTGLLPRLLVLSHAVGS